MSVRKNCVLPVTITAFQSDVRHLLHRVIVTVVYIHCQDINKIITTSVCAGLMSTIIYWSRWKILGNNNNNIYIPTRSSSSSNSSSLVQSQFALIVDYVKRCWAHTRIIAIILIKLNFTRFRRVFQCCLEARRATHARVYRREFFFMMCFYNESEKIYFSFFLGF